MHLYVGGGGGGASLEVLNNFTKTHRARTTAKNIHKTVGSVGEKPSNQSKEKAFSLLQQLHFCDGTSFESQRNKKAFALNAQKSCTKRQENNFKNAKKFCYSVPCCYPDKHANKCDF